MATNPAHMHQRVQQLAEELRTVQNELNESEGETVAPQPTESARKEYYVEEIQRLRAEMDDMKKELRAQKRKEQAAPATPARRVLGALIAHSNAAFLSEDEGGALHGAADSDAEHSDHSDHDDDDDDLAAEASEALTGIRFTACATHAQSPHTTALTAHGTTHGVAFRVSVHVRNDTTEIEHMDVALPHDVREALGGFVARVCEARSLRGFLRGLVAYARINTRRTALFTACKEAQPAAVTLPHGAAHAASMVMRGAGGHVTLQLVWDVRVDEFGEAREHVALLPRVSAAVAAHDSEHLADRLPALFHKLAQEQGLSAAAQSVLALTCS